VIVTFRKRRCFAKENVAGLGMRVNLKTQSRFSGGKLVIGANNTAKKFHLIGRTRYQRDIKEVRRSPCPPRGTSYSVIDTIER